MRLYDFHLIFRSAEMRASILVVRLMGYVLNKGIEFAERRFVHWVGR
ncbi:ABC transporter protein, membrane protein (fragment) [Candidatus Methylomirabilis oxygeniifera]|uniref:ABC transporter protein, membrane protein n=1 Tax=Methylomirabilis oxygeniifera TaxID=671143 RepID=D5MH53_METO1